MVERILGIPQPDSAADIYRAELHDLSRMAEPAIVSHLASQIKALTVALNLKDEFWHQRQLKLGADVLERYGVNPILVAVLTEYSPETLSVRPTEEGTWMDILNTRNSARIYVNPRMTYPLVGMDLLHENDRRRRLTELYPRNEALKIIGSKTLTRAQDFLDLNWRLHSSSGITEEYRQAQGLIWSVAHAAEDAGFPTAALHPYYNRDITTVRNP